MTHESDDWEVMTGPEPAWDRVWRRRSGRARTVIAATTVAVLALGGTVAYAATSGGSGGSATPSATGSALPSPDGRGGRHGGHWFDFGGMGVHGESTVKDQDTGKWVIRVWQRGTVEKVDGQKVTVKSEDGAEWTWTVEKSTTVLHDGTTSSGTGALKKNETAFLTGTRSNDNTNTATRVLSGTWDSKGPRNGMGPDDDKGRNDDKGPGGNWHGNFPGHGPKDWRMPSPSTSPSDSGATT